MGKGSKTEKGAGYHQNALLRKIYPFISSLESLIKRLQRISGSEHIAEGKLPAVWLANLH